MAETRSKKAGIGGTRVWLVASLVIQNSLAALVGKITRTPSSNSSELYSIKNFLLICESFKFALSVILEIYSCGSVLGLLSGVRCHIIQKPIDAIKGSLVLALLYTISNAMQYVALTYLSAPVFQVLIQAKLVMTALMSVLVFNRTYSTKQWISLVVLSAGVALVVFSEEGEAKRVSNDEERSMSDNIKGIAAVSLVCTISSSAGIYFERVLKHDRKENLVSPSLWLRNLMLSFFSIVIISLQILHDRFSVKPEMFPSKPFLQGFTPLVWLQTVLFSCGGLLVAAVIQHADNVVKSVATAISVVLTSVLSAALMRTRLSTLIYLGAAMIMFAVMTFFGSCQMSLLAKIIRKPSVIGLCHLLVLLQWKTHTHLLESFLSGSEMYEAMIVNSSEIMRDLEKLASTGSSLDTLTSIQNALQERNHEVPHILYDIRTKLGNRPAKYLEIGSYAGLSSALMLKHPYPTHVTALDPCTSPPLDFNGSLSQEATIRMNVLSFEGKNCNFKSPWRLIVGHSPPALPVGETFDIIFVDGNHSNEGVLSDYKHTQSMLRPGGFMVFGSYDSRFSPAVKPTVDAIAQKTELVPIGSVVLGKNLTHHYILHRRGSFNPKPQQVGSMPVLCVVAATYRRDDGSSKDKLEALWEMLKQQSYTNWKLYLTGDKYDDLEEWKTLSFFNESQASIYNLPAPGERNKLSGMKLWFNAGSTALNNAISRAVSDGHEWVVQTGDDDIWDADHLEHIYSGIGTGATFVTTSCQYAFHGHFPRETAEWWGELRLDVPPRPCGVIAASVAWNARLLPSRYVFDDSTPNDAHLWGRIVFDDAFFPVFVPSMSCYHLSERSSPPAKKIVRKIVMPNIELPGWYKDHGAEVLNYYHTLATHQFPSNISSNCIFVVGPEEGHPNFYLLAKTEVPYHIRTIQTFHNISVWKKK